MNITDKGREKALETKRMIRDNRRVKVKQMLQEGQSITKIARHFGVSPRTISNDLKATD